jgi:hypothetical protein
MPRGRGVPRYARNMRLADTIYQWTFGSLTASPGARSCYNYRRAAGDTHHAALRRVSNRLVGILHGCLVNHTAYDGNTAGDTEPRSNLSSWLDSCGRGISIRWDCSSGRRGRPVAERTCGK